MKSNISSLFRSGNRVLVSGFKRNPRLLPTMAHKKKVAIIFPKDSESFFNKKSKLTFGGANVQMFLIGTEMQQHKDVSVSFLINEYDNIDCSIKESLNIVPTFRLKDSCISKVLKFHKRLQEIQPEYIIQRGLSLYSCMLALYCRIYGIRFIFMFAHDREIFGRYQTRGKKALLYPLLLKFSHNLVCQSEHQMAALSRRYRKKTALIRTGYQIPDIDYCPEKKTTILWVGRLESWKRAELFVKLAELNKGFEFVMIAPPIKNDTEYSDMIYDIATHVKNLKMIHFVSFFEIEHYFRDAALFVNTSIQEGFPNTFIQAAKNMTPIVSLNVNPDSFLGKFKCGVWCDNSFVEMNNSLKLLMKDQKLRSEMAINGYKYVKNNHHIVKTVNELKKLF